MSLFIMRRTIDLTQSKRINDFEAINSSAQKTLPRKCLPAVLTSTREQSEASDPRTSYLMVLPNESGSWLMLGTQANIQIGASMIAAT